MRKKQKVKNVVDLWLKSQKYSVKESTYSHYYEIVYNHIIPLLGEYDIMKIDRNIIADFNNYLLKYGNKKANKGLSCKTIQDINVILKQLLSFTGNDVKFKNVKLSKRIVDILNKDEQSLLENYCINNLTSYTLGIIISLNTGMRIGEICALKWEDVDMKNRLIKVNHTILRIRDTEYTNKSKVIVTSPKTNTSLRTIPINKKLYDLLVMFCSENSNYVLTNSSKYIEPRNYSARYMTILRKLKIEQYNFHSLRHTFATRCVELGVDAKNLSEILGHTNVKTTMSLYVHPSLETQKEYLERLC